MHSIQSNASQASVKTLVNQVSWISQYKRLFGKGDSVKFGLSPYEVLRCSACHLWRTATQVAQVRLHAHTGVILQVSYQETSLRELTQQPRQPGSTQLNTAQLSWARLCIIHAAGRPVPVCVVGFRLLHATKRRNTCVGKTPSQTGTSQPPLFHWTDCVPKSHIAPSPFAVVPQHRCCLIDTHTYDFELLGVVFFAFVEAQRVLTTPQEG